MMHGSDHLFAGVSEHPSRSSTGIQITGGASDAISALFRTPIRARSVSRVLKLGTLDRLAVTRCHREEPLGVKKWHWG